MTPELDSYLRLDVITTMLYRNYDKVYGYDIDRIYHPRIRGARVRLTDFEKRIRAGEALSEDEIHYVDWLSWQVTTWRRTGELAGDSILVDGVWQFVLHSGPSDVLAILDNN